MNSDQLFSATNNLYEVFSLKIAFVDEDLSLRTGSRRFTYEVARQLQTLGHEVKVFTDKLDKKTCFPEYLSMPIEMLSKGQSLRRGTPVPKYPSLKKNVLLNFAAGLAFAFKEDQLALRISKKVAEAHCDVILFQYHGGYWMPPYFYYFRRSNVVTYLNMIPRMPRPFALPFQELNLRNRIENSFRSHVPPMGLWEKLSFGKIGLFLAPSSFQLKQATRLRVVGRRKTEVLPLGVDHSRFHPIGVEEPFALYLGRIHPQKSLELAILSMKNAPNNYSLVIAGDIEKEEFAYKNKLISLAEKMNLSDRFRLILNPSDSQVTQLMQKCSIFLFPSTIESFGLVVLEAMACGKPVVACKRGGVPEIVSDAGFLLEPSPEQWRTTVSRLLSDSVFRRKMGQKAFERAKVFSWEKVTESLLSAFREITT